MMLASQGRLKTIFLGAALAFLIQSLISVLLGEILVLLPQTLVHVATGLLFLFFSFSFWKQSLKSADLSLTLPEISAKSVFVIVFMAEFGDVSQLAIATTALNSTSKFAVFVLSVIAMWLITGIALLVGHNLKHVMNPSLIQKIASVLFLAFGSFLLYQALV